MSKKRDQQICFTPEDIVSVKSDVIVSSIHRSKDLSIGYLSSHINKTGGSEICKELKKHPKELEFGQIVRTAPGKLVSKYLLFVCLERWRAGNEETLRQSVYDCLKLASEENFTSIAFPALGMGGLGYNPFISASMIMTAIHQYFDDCAVSSIKTVYICVQNKDAKQVQNFVDSCCAVILATMGDGEEPAMKISGIEKFYTPHDETASTSSTSSKTSGASVLPGLVVDVASKLLPLLATKGFQFGCARNSTSPISCEIRPGFNASNKTIRIQTDIQLSIPKLLKLFSRK